MNEYEEFGLTPTATREQIQKAHRAVARLLHPDNFQDEELKRLAECQMKRLNGVYARLTDPGRPPEPSHASGLRTAGEGGGSRAVSDWWRNNGSFDLLRRNLVWLAATVGCLIGIYWVLNSLGGHGASAGTLRPVAAAPANVPGEDAFAAKEAELAQSLRALRQENRELRRRLERALEQRGPSRDPMPANAGVATEPPPGTTARVAPEAPAPVLSLPSANIPSIPQIIPNRLPPPGAPKTVEGTWVYALSGRDQGSREQYPAEYIEVVISRTGGKLSGRYRGRYRVADLPISPEVQFRFDGDAAGSESYRWTGNGGAEGQVKLKLLSDDTLSVEWFTSRLGAQATLGSGAAVLVRRRD